MSMKIIHPVPWSFSSSTVPAAVSFCSTHMAIPETFTPITESLANCRFPMPRFLTITTLLRAGLL